jgi:hypothetical protein
MSTHTESQIELTREVRRVLALTDNLDAQQRLELTSSILSTLAHEMEPKDRLTLAAALVKQAVQRVGPAGLAEMTQRLPRSGEQFDKFIHELCNTEARPGKYRNGDTRAVKDSVILRDQTFDVMLVAVRQPKPNLEWMQAISAGYRVGTREESIAYATKLLDKQKEMETEMAQHEISRLQNKISRFKGLKIPPVDTLSSDRSKWPNEYEQEALDFYLNKDKIWGPVRDIEGIVWIDKSNGYDICTKECCFFSYGPIENVYSGHAQAHTASLMFFVRESQKYEG